MLIDEIFLKKSITIIAGPCTISNYENLYNTALALRSIGIQFLRGGAFKLRTSIDSFQGLGAEGIDILNRVGTELNMVTVSEITSVEHLHMMANKIDIFLVGTRSMHNYPLLEALGRISNPVILKRGMGSTIQEWLQAADYIAQNGNQKIILCERGIRTFEPSTRFTLDVSAIPVAHELCPFPIFADPSHSSGDRKLIKSMSWAALAAGAEGLIIETEINPDQAICDAPQTIGIEELKEILQPIQIMNGLWRK